MMAKPMKTLELHYPMIQFLINVYILVTKYGLLTKCEVKLSQDGWILVKFFFCVFSRGP